PSTTELYTLSLHDALPISVSRATEEMASSVKEIGRQIEQSTSITCQAVAQATKTDASISELSRAAQRIGDVVNLITAIANQTNLDRKSTRLNSSHDQISYA